MKDRIFGDRRAALKAIGGIWGVMLLGSGQRAWAKAAAGNPDVPSCLLEPSMTEGPFFVDEKLNRSDVTLDTHGKARPSRRPGLPLSLAFAVHAYDQGTCTPLPAAQVDIWHADASGAYSDTENFGGRDTTGQDFLRGYQITDAGGLVRFTTIYPGWYPGRTVHVHVKVRLFDRSRNLTTEATTQVFFDDKISDAVYGSHPVYKGRGARPTKNGDDDIFDHHDEMILGLAGSPATGYQGALALGIRVGTVAREEHGFHGPPPRRGRGR